MDFKAGKALGPTFSQELRGAGLTGLPFTWGDDGSLQFDDARMTPEQIAAVKVLVAAHDPMALPPPVPKGPELAEGFFGGLPGTPAQKLARAVALTVVCPRLLAFLALLQTPTQSGPRLAFLKAVWGSIKADAVGGTSGSAPAHLTAAEATAIETLAASYGVPLA